MGQRHGRPHRRVRTEAGYCRLAGHARCAVSDKLCPSGGAGWASDRRLRSRQRRRPRSLRSYCRRSCGRSRRPACRSLMQTLGLTPQMPEASARPQRADGSPLAEQRRVAGGHPAPAAGIADLPPGRPRTGSVGLAGHELGTAAATATAASHQEAHVGGRERGGELFDQGRREAGGVVFNGGDGHAGRGGVEDFGDTADRLGRRRAAHAGARRYRSVGSESARGSASAPGCGPPRPR